MGTEPHHPPWDSDSATAMAQLCRLFPSLRDQPGADPWDPMQMLRSAVAAKRFDLLGLHIHTEQQLAARFVLSVWNIAFDWEDIARKEGLIADGDDSLHLPRFDLFAAFRTWDDSHRRAFLTWALDPF